jgi:hypothetical protein
MYQNPPRYAPGPTRLTLPPKPRGRVVPILFLLAVITGGLFGGTYAFSAEPDVRLLPGIAFAQVDGLDAVLVPYERHGTRGLFQVITQDTVQSRLAAVEATSGTILWDARLSDQRDVSVLAAGQRLAYLATGSGLMVVDLADGAVVAEGLGFAAAPRAFAFDAAGQRVLGLTAAGEVRAVGLDQTQASPVDAATSAAWAGRLSTEPGPAAPTIATGPEAAVAGSAERVALQDLPFGMPGSMLVRVTVDGLPIPVGGVAFVGGQLVIEGGAAVGATTGHVLIEHRDTVEDRSTTLSVVTLDSGRITGSVTVESPVDRALVGPNGMTAVVARDVLAVAHADGDVVSVDVGATNFFGTPGTD